MYSSNRVLRISLIVQFIIALLFGTAVFYVLRLITPVVSSIVLILLLSLVFFFAMSILRARWLMRQNQPNYRPGNRYRRGGDAPDSGGSGVREPRRPYPPSSPPRAAVLDPDQADR